MTNVEKKKINATKVAKIVGKLDAADQEKAVLMVETFAMGVYVGKSKITSNSTEKLKTT